MKKVSSGAEKYLRKIIVVSRTKNKECAVVTPCDTSLPPPTSTEQNPEENLHISTEQENDCGHPKTVRSLENDVSVPLVDKEVNSNIKKDVNLETAVHNGSPTNSQNIDAVKDLKDESTQDNYSAAFQAREESKEPAEDSSHKPHKSEGIVLKRAISRRLEAISGSLYFLLMSIVAYVLQLLRLTRRKHVTSHENDHFCDSLCSAVTCSEPAEFLAPHACERNYEITERVARLEMEVQKITSPCKSGPPAEETINLSPAQVKALESELAETKKTLRAVLTNQNEIYECLENIKDLKWEKKGRCL